jgi:hypothetical protein
MISWQAKTIKKAPNEAIETTIYMIPWQPKP